jgi:predicted acylesterase/phospholipase RssA/CRP-like cAMP-binding protein
VQPTRVDAHGPLFGLGDPADAVFIVRTGALELVRSYDGADSADVEMGPGSWVGVAAAQGGRRSASVRAGAVGATLLRLGADALRSMTEQHPALATALGGLVSRDLHDLRSATSELFGSDDPAFLRALEARLQRRSLHAQERLFQEGDEPDGLYLVRSGRLIASVEQPDGSPRAVREFGHGETVGELGVMTGERRSASLHAQRDSRLLFLSTDDFNALFAKFPKAYGPLMRAIARRLRHTGPGAATRDGSAPRPVRGLCVACADPRAVAAGVPRLLAEALGQAGRVLVLDAARMDAIHGSGASAAERGDPRWSHLDDWFIRCEDDHDLVLYDAGAADGPWAARCRRQADRMLIVVADADAALADRRDNAAPPAHAPVTLLVLHPDRSSRPKHTGALIDAFDADRHHHVALDQPVDFGRVARSLTGRSVGVVLGGGGMRGLAHVGLLRAMVEAGIPIDHIGGTSMGAAIAAFWASSPSLETLHERCIACANANFHRSVQIPPVWSLLDGNALTRLMRRLCGDVQIEDLWTDYFSVSSNITRSEPWIHRRGALSKAVRASFSVPGLYAPVVDNGDLLVDGGLLNNVPVDIMRESGAGIVIACDVGSTRGPRVDPSVTEYPKASELALGWVRKHDNKKLRFPNAAAVISHSVVVASSHHRKKVAEQADLMVRPDLRGISMFDVKRLDELIEIGYRDASEALSQRDWGARPQ